jgi:hypothetical protein
MTLRSLVITLAIIGLALISGAGASAQSEEAPAPIPVEFNGRVAFGDCKTESTAVVDGITEARGVDCHVPVLEISDPRLDGEVTIRVNNDAHPGGLTLYMWGYRIENEGGAWQQLPNLAFDYPDGGASTKTVILDGEGGYEGLTAVAEVALEGSIWDLHGFIIEGEVPPIPDPVAAR